MTSSRSVALAGRGARLVPSSDQVTVADVEANVPDPDPGNRALSLERERAREDEGAKRALRLLAARDHSVDADLSASHRPQRRELYWQQAVGGPVEQRIEAVVNARVCSRTELDGGMIGTVHRVTLDDGRTVVAKTGQTPLGVEGRMLRYLDAHGLPVPGVIHASESLLLLSYVEGETRITPAVERDAAEKLAALHATTAEAFGFPFDTLTGTVPQPNPWTDRWIRFYRDHRLQPVRERCLDADVLDPDLDERLAVALDRLPERLVEPPAPALLHGDVWENNLLTDGQRVTAFLDPACYYGHPEVELAYVDWTDTFGEPFFDRYDEQREIADGFFTERRFLYRLYPLLVHLLLFGPPYDEELAETLDRVDVP